MKKTGILFTVLLLTAGLVGCGESKTTVDNASADDASAVETTVSETTDAAAESQSDTEKADGVCSIAGKYYLAGYDLMGDIPEGYDKETVEDAYRLFKEMIIAEDGSFTFLEKDYQLEEVWTSGKSAYFSIQGSGFDFEKYQNENKCGDMDYVGPCAIEQIEQHITINDEDTPYLEYHLIFKNKGTESLSGYYTFLVKDF